MQLNLTIGRNKPLIWVLILPGFIGLIPLMISLELSNKYTPETDAIFLTTMVAYLISAIVFPLKGVKAIRTEVGVELANNELQIRILRKTFFNKIDFKIGLKDIINLYDDIDQDLSFLYIETNQAEHTSFQLISKSSDTHFQEFIEALELATKLCQTENPNRKEVVHASIYSKWPMQLFGFTLLVFWIIFPIMIWQYGSDWLYYLKYLGFVLISFPIVYKSLMAKLKR